MHAGECGRITLPVTNVSQTLDFPETLAVYDANKNCTWILTSSDPASGIKIEFESFETEFRSDNLTVSKY